MRHVIHLKLFLGWTDNQCVPVYNGCNGSNATMGSCILKKIKVEAGKWFLEEGVVLPWSLRNERNESILRYYGLRKKNFPCPCQTSNAAVKAASVRQERKQHPIRAAVKVPSSTIFDADFRHWQEDEKTEVDFDEQNSGAPSLHDLARAATNAFGVDAEEEDPSVPMIAGHCHYKVQADALLKHCGFAQDNTIEGRIAAEIFVKGHDAVIVRALISTISPSPRTTLSDYDIGFWDTTLFDGMTQCRDILGVVDGNNYEARKLVWDLNA